MPTDDMKHAENMEDARRTYGSFMGTLKWSVPLIAAIAAFVVILIAS